MTREWLEFLCLANTVLLLGAIVRLMTHIWAFRREESRLFRENQASVPASTSVRSSPQQIESEIEDFLWQQALEKDPQSTEILRSICVTSMSDLLKLPDSTIQDICADAGLETVLTALLTLDEKTQNQLLRALSRSQRQELEKSLQRRAKWNDFTRQMRNPGPDVAERACQTVMALAQKRI